jgi:hypothetical protein
MDTDSAVHDFDFFAGKWHVHHRRLKERLAGATEWQDFEGTTTAQKLMGGHANLDDNTIELPSGSYRAVTLPAFDPQSKEWIIWWLDGRNPGHLDPPVRDSFSKGVGTFYADDTFNAKPIRVRFVWSHITAKSCRWEQAFSPDGGTTWEANWVMDFTRVE